MIKVNRVAGGQRNTTLHITGCIENDIPMTPVYTGTKETGTMKLGSILWVIQEKLGIYLWWNKEQLLMPLESRNAIRLDAGYVAPKDWDGNMYISSYNFAVEPRCKTKAFFLLLDFDR